MADERELIEEREKKAEEIRALGGNPYANGFTPSHTAAAIHERFKGAQPPPPPPPG
jgi:lysyl-tRNA synthetase class II